MNKISGTIEAVARSGKVIKIGEEWYSAFKVGQLNGAGKGDTVELSYKTVNKGGRDFHNIEGNVTVIGGAPREAANESNGRAGTSVAPGATTARDVSIVRQSSLNRATEILAIAYDQVDANSEVLVAEAIDLAKQFEAYVLGENA